MKIKKIVCLILIGLTVNSIFGQAQLGPHKWTAAVKVIGEDGAPLTGANVSVSYSILPPPSDPNQKSYGEVKGETDANGIFTASHTDGSLGLGINVTKAGYYTSGTGYQFYFDDKRRNPSFTLVLRKIGKPIPMYVRRKEEGMVLQKEDEPMGFDLKAGDWVAPYRIGTNVDMLFTIHRKIINRREFDCTLKVSFPNKGDGIVAAPSEEFAGSVFRTSRTAAENGYEPELNLRFINTELATNVFGYFIRVETSLDENGNVKSALFGKISGNFKLYAGTIKPHSGMGFDYYLNPTPNDHNLEFDPKHNLSTNLKLLEGVNAP
jgi:hypothetical protein